jgi:hypothetical protein
MDYKETRERIRQEEIDSRLKMKKITDSEETLLSYVEEYQKLGWQLAALNPENGMELPVDFGEPPEIWIDRLSTLGLNAKEISLGIITGQASGLMVLEIAPEQAKPLLDLYGPWRSECVAALGSHREQHYYAWQPFPLWQSIYRWETPDFKWYGEGQVVLAPPSFSPEFRESWRWLSSPWENPLPYPSEYFHNFFERQINREVESRFTANLSWQEIYCLVSPYKPLLKALSTPSPVMEDYYQNILQAAREAGLNSPEVLISLLWHAPCGDARQQPERWNFLEKLVMEVQSFPEPTAPEGNLVDLFLDNLVMDGIENNKDVINQGKRPEGPPCLLKRRPVPASQVGSLPRKPLSVCQKQGNLPGGNDDGTDYQEK